VNSRLGKGIGPNFYLLGIDNGPSPVNIRRWFAHIWVASRIEGWASRVVSISHLSTSSGEQTIPCLLRVPESIYDMFN
jgi:hypothetical protein